MPQHDAAGLPDLELYHTVDYSACESHYHGQASNTVNIRPHSTRETTKPTTEERQHTGEEVNSFVWQPTKSSRKKKTLPQEPTITQPQSEQGVGYQKRTLPIAFYHALGIPTPSLTQSDWTCKVAPIYVRKIPSSRQGTGHYNAYYLADVATRQRRTVRLFTIIQDTTIPTWTGKQTKEYLLDHTAEAMRIVMLHDVKYSPLRKWSDATWYFSWSLKHACCLILPYTEIAHDDIRVQRPSNYA